MPVPNRPRHDPDARREPEALDLGDDDDLDEVDGAASKRDDASVAREAQRAAKARQMLEALARRIRNLRERRALTQDEFATRCGISVSFASLLERGERSPSYETLVTIAEALEVPLSELFRDPGSEPVEDPYHARLLDFARKARLSHTQVDRFISVGTAMFDLSPVAASELRKKTLPTTCTLSGCGRPVLARGMCTSHYHKARRGQL